MKQFFDALRLAAIAAVEKYKEIRYYQNGGNPDEVPF